MNFGKAIKKFRTEVNLNQRDFAKECGISQSSLYQIESNQRRPTPRILKKMCFFLELPIAVIYLTAMDESDLTEKNQQLYLTTYLNLTKSLIDILLTQVPRKIKQQ